MNLYQLTECGEKGNHAGTKATADIAAIAEQLGYTKVPVIMRSTKEGLVYKMQRQTGYLADWSRAYFSIPKESIVLLQHPFHHKQLIRNKVLASLKKNKKVRYICLVHDVEELRAYRFNDYYKKEFEFMLSIADAIIVHNEKMAEFFYERGVPSDKIIYLEIFDYLQNKPGDMRPCFEKSINVAGNLDVAKAEYIGHLGEINVNVHLFGPNVSPELIQNDKIQYHGSFPPEQIPYELSRGFGLVWDGSSIDGCKGKSGQYLRYNNPHKLSLYLSSGLPVIIWCGAAEADFVRNNGVGILVDSLQDISTQLSHLNEDDYNVIVNNVMVVADRLKNGFYAKKALHSAEQTIEETE